MYRLTRTTSFFYLKTFAINRVFLRIIYMKGVRVAHAEGRLQPALYFFITNTFLFKNSYVYLQ
jgi:hypothetical protein